MAKNYDLTNPEIKALIERKKKLTEELKALELAKQKKELSEDVRWLETRVNDERKKS
jgi:phage terminase small subunit